MGDVGGRQRNEEVKKYDLRFAICDFRFAIFDLRFSICDFRFAIFDLRFSICDFRFTIELLASSL